jgi:hypothetical protein
MRTNWLTWVVVVIVSVILGAFIARRFIKPPVSPPPGDVIILRPHPVNSANANSTYWLIGGDEPIPVEEYGNTRLNKNAFPYVSDYYGRVTLPTGGLVKVFPGQMKAHFRHCKTATIKQCDSDADCGQSDTCFTSELILKRVTNSGTKDKFEWWLDGVLQQSYDYQDSRKWRGELCGRLDTTIGLSFVYNGQQYNDIQVPDTEEINITATTTAAP